MREDLHDVAGKRRPPAQHVISHRSQRINVSARVQRDARLHLFRRHVFRRAENSARRRPTPGSEPRKTLADDLRQTKVTDFHDVIAGERAVLFLSLDNKDVRGFQIAMQNAFVVRGFDAGADLPQQPERALHRDRAFAAQELIERFAFDVFHHQKEDAFLALAKISHVNDVRMLNRGRGAGLALKPRDRFAFLEVFIREHVRPNCFHRDSPREQVFVARQIHLAHRAAAETFPEAIAPIQ